MDGSFTLYDRITDVLMYFNNNITFNFVVKLSRRTFSGERRFFHYEVEKPGATRGSENTFSINRRPSFFFTIDFKNGDFMSNIVLFPQDVYMLNDIIERMVMPWFRGYEEKQYAFQVVNDKLALKEFTPVIYTQSEIKYIKFQPAVMVNRNDQYSFAIDLNFSGLHYVQLELERFIQFVYLLHSDMYAVASSMINYAKIQPYHVNVFRSFGLGGGKVEDQFVDTNDDKEASYSATEIQSATPPTRSNSFLENSSTKTNDKKKGN